MLLTHGKREEDAGVTVLLFSNILQIPNFVDYVSSNEYSSSSLSHFWFINVHSSLL